MCVAEYSAKRALSVSAEWGRSHLVVTVRRGVDTEGATLTEPQLLRDDKDEFAESRPVKQLLVWPDIAQSNVYRAGLRTLMMNLSCRHIVVKLGRHTHFRLSVDTPQLPHRIILALIYRSMADTGCS